MGSFLTQQSLRQVLPVFQQGVGLVTTAAQTANAFNQSDSAQEQALRELQERQNAGLQDLQERSALERQEIEANAARDDRRRRASLRRSVARQRAAFGSSGIASGAGGSSEAVLLGFVNESADEQRERERLDSLRFGAIDQNVASQRRLNLIQRTQLQQRQNIANLSRSADRVSQISDLGFEAFDFYGNLRSAFLTNP